MIKQVSEKLWAGNYLRAWLANFLLFFSFYLLTPLFPLYLSETFHADKQVIGIVLSGYTLTALLIRFFGGYLVDSFPRKTVLLISFFLFCLFFVGYPLASSLFLFAIVRTLHGAPFGMATISNSTVAVDVLPPSRRMEGIGYYGLSNNIATAISPSVALLIYAQTGNYDLLFLLAIVFSGLAFFSNYTMKLEARPIIKRPSLSLDNFLLLNAWRHGLCIACYSFAYGVLATYIAVYGKEELGITQGTGLFFMLFSVGLIISRLTSNRSLRMGKIVQNATIGGIIHFAGYFIFAGIHHWLGYYGAAFIIGFGLGHMTPAFQTMFLDLASNEQRGTANSTFLVSWDVGMGLGIFLGGVIAEHVSYQAAFWTISVVCMLGVIFFLASAKGYYLKNKLR